MAIIDTRVFVDEQGREHVADVHGTQHKPVSGPIRMIESRVTLQSNGEAVVPALDRPGWHTTQGSHLYLRLR